METHCAHEAPKTTAGKSPSGLRRMTLAMLATGHTAEAFTGLPEDGKHGRVLAAFKAAAPCLGIQPRAVHAIDWLFKFTRPQDWVDGARPIVWPSAFEQQEGLSLGPTQVKAINRYLVEAGLVVMKDSSNGKRWGRRDKKGQITEAYGFDLSPLAARMAEFQALAAQDKERRDRMKRLRRRGTIARQGLRQIIETADEYNLVDASWTKLEEEGMALARSLRKVERVEEMELGVAALERRQREAREKLENLFARANPRQSEAVNSDPKGPENRPHIITTNQLINPSDTVMALEGSRTGADVSELATSSQVERKQEGRTEQTVRTDDGAVMRVTPEELLQLAPKLRAHLRTTAPKWHHIVDAADYLRQDLGVSKALWGEACLVMDRQKAAIAMAVVSVKPEGYFKTNAAGYFYGMVAKAKEGELNLGRTIWGLRSGGNGPDPKRRL